MDDRNIIYYRQIKDSFWYGKYSNYNVVLDKNTGYINASKFCMNNGKTFSAWHQNIKTKQLFDTFETPSYQIKGCNKDEIQKQYTGTYILPEILLHLITWIDDMKNKEIKRGLIYVITNSYLEYMDIYQIGTCNGNIQERVDYINKTRHSLEFCFVKLLYSCDNVKKLEFNIYNKLNNYRDHEEFFNCPLNIIEEMFKQEDCKQIV